MPSQRRRGTVDCCWPVWREKERNDVLEDAHAGDDLVHQLDALVRVARELALALEDRGEDLDLDRHEREHEADARPRRRADHARQQPERNLCVRRGGKNGGGGESNHR